jgi:hypothetical protein
MQVDPAVLKNHGVSGGALPETDLIRRKCACGEHTGGGGECDACKKKRLQRSVAHHVEPANVPVSVHHTLHSEGQPLDASTRAFMEPRFGRDFSGIRVHRDSGAAVSAHEVNALAYTAGRHIVFGQNQYQPDTASGRQLMAHELTHTLQQENAGDSISRAGAFQLGSAHDPQEGEANRVAEAVMSGSTERPLATRTSPFTIRRQTGAGTESTQETAPSGTLPSHKASEQWANEVDLGRFSRYSHGRADARLNREPALEHTRRGGRGQAPPCQLDLFLKLHFDFHLGPSPFRQGPTGGMTAEGPPWPQDKAAQWKRDYMRIAQATWRTRHPLEQAGNCPAEPCSSAIGQLRIVDADSMTDSEGQSVPSGKMGNSPHYYVRVYEFRPWAGQQESRVGGIGSTMFAEDVLPRDTPRPGGLDQSPLPDGTPAPPVVGEERYRWMPGAASHETGHMLGRPHVNCSPDEDNPNNDLCYGGTEKQKANVMGRGEEMSREDHAPFLAAMRATTGCDWKVASSGWPWWAYLLIALTGVGLIALGVAALAGAL